MRYLLLIHSDEAAWQALSDEEKAPAYQRYGALADEMRERGHLVGGDELAPPESAKLVRSTPGGPTVLDGPFAETKEQLGGYFLVECELDTAIDYAARIPGRTRHDRGPRGGRRTGARGLTDVGPTTRRSTRCGTCC